MLHLTFVIEEQLLSHLHSGSFFSWRFTLISPQTVMFVGIERRCDLRLRTAVTMIKRETPKFGFWDAAATDGTHNRIATSSISSRSGIPSRRISLPVTDTGFFCKEAFHTFRLRVNKQATLGVSRSSEFVSSDEWYSCLFKNLPCGNEPGRRSWRI